TSERLIQLPLHHSITPTLQSSSSYPERFLDEQTLQRQFFLHQTLFNLITVERLDRFFVGVRKHTGVRIVTQQIALFRIPFGVCRLHIVDRLSIRLAE